MISVRPDPVRYIDQLDADTGPADDADKVQVETLKRPSPAPHLSFMFRVPAAEIFKLSLSPFFDDIAVFHVRAVRRITVTIPHSDNNNAILFSHRQHENSGVSQTFPAVSPRKLSRGREILSFRPATSSRS